MATYGGRHGGPGFEGDLVRDWLRAALPNAPAMLLRVSSDQDMTRYSKDSWAWRLWAGGECQAFRLTKKEVRT
jgi:hypothetical protein